MTIIIITFTHRLKHGPESPARLPTLAHTNIYRYCKDVTKNMHKDMYLSLKKVHERIIKYKITLMGGLSGLANN